MIAPLLLYFNHILVFFIGLFEFSLKVLTSIYRVTVNHFRMGGREFYRSFIIGVDYFIILNFVTEIHFSILVFSPLSTDIFCYYIA